MQSWSHEVGCLQPFLLIIFLVTGVLLIEAIQYKSKILNGFKWKRKNSKEHKHPKHSEFKEQIITNNQAFLMNPLFGKRTLYQISTSLYIRKRCLEQLEGQESCGLDPWIWMISYNCYFPVFGIGPLYLFCSFLWFLVIPLLI